MEQCEIKTRGRRKGRSMQQCEIETSHSEGSFEELKEAMAAQKYWLRFFIRPCCPAPGMHAAAERIEHLKSDIDAREDMTPQQRDELKAICDERLQWYGTLAVRKGK